MRTSGQDAALLADINADDGDRAFRAGLISERLDLTTVLDVTRGDFGAELSADGWYDAAYHGGNDDRSASSFNPVTVPVGRFPADVRRLMGGEVELGRAYVRDRLLIGDLPVTVRIGRQTLLWGESLFFAGDGIAGAQAPVDLIKQSGQPLLDAQEVYLPVTQADISIRLRPGLTFEAYDQVEWRRDRIPGVGSYFSTTDVLDTGGQRLLLPGGRALFRARDDTPDGAGQFGAALRWDGGKLGLGLYALRYDAKSPELGRAGSDGYRLVFPRGIELLGASVSTYLGDATLSGEVSFRRHAPLASRFDVTAPGPDFATGRTVQGLASYDSVVPPGRLWDGASLQAEVAATGLVGVDTGAAARLPRSTAFALAVQAVFTPTYFQVVRDVDLRVPVGFGLGVAGRSSVDAGRDAGTGNVTLGVSLTWHVVWEAGLAFTHFLGESSAQPLADRDFVSLSIARTF